MRNFFIGWRRKTGLILLAMALALTVFWMRSYELYDTASVLCPMAHHRIDSELGRLLWQCDRPSSTDARRLNRTTFNWMTLHNPDPSLPVAEGAFDSLHEYDVDWQWKWSQFNFGAGRERAEPVTLDLYSDSEGGPSKLKAIFDYRKAWAAPYWSLVLPLTLLSAYLMFGKRRRSDRRPGFDSQHRRTSVEQA
jgi:hypothetical protein